MSARCVARVPPSTYQKDARQCEKPARTHVLGAALCRHHEAKGRRGGFEIWAPALERRRP